MAKKTAGAISGGQINLGLSGDILNRVKKAGEAEAGVGEFANEGFAGALDSLYDYGKEKFDDAKTEVEDEKKKQEEKAEAAEKQFNKAAEDVLAVQGSLGTNYFDPVYDEVEQLKEQFLNSTSEKERARVFQEMNRLKAEVDGVKGQRADLADAQKKGLLSNQTNPETKAMFEAYLGNKTEVFLDEEGNRKHKAVIDGKEVVFSQDDINDLTKYKDTKFDASLSKIMYKSKNSGLTGEYFDMDGATKQIRNSITKDNIGSLIHDPMGGGNSFSDDLKAGMANLKYKDLDLEGVIEKQEGEDHWSDNISEEDLDKLHKALTDPNDPNYNADVTKKSLENYFVALVDQQNKTTTKYRSYKSDKDATIKGQYDAIKDVAETEKKKELGYNPSGDVDSYMKLFEGE